MPSATLSILGIVCLTILGALIWFVQERQEVEKNLKKANDELETSIEQRTLELQATIEQLSYEIAERRQAESALKESEERFRLLAENSTDMISRHSPEGLYLYVSPACYTLLGYEPEELIGHSAYEFQHPNDAVEVLQTHTTLLRELNTHVVTYRIRHKNNYYIWVESTARSLYDEQTNKVVEIHVASRDITQRKQTEQTNALLATAIEQAGDAIKITDAETRIQYANPAFEIISGYKRTEVLHKPLLSHLWGEENDRTVYETIWNTISQGETWSGTMVGKRKDGTLYDQEATISPVHNTAGILTHFVIVKRDVTKRKQIELELKKALEKERELGELKSRFVSMTSHEFRTPLTIILSSANLLENYGQHWTEEKKMVHIKRIKTGATRMNHLLEDILMFGKADAGKLQWQPLQLNLAQFCLNFIEDLKLSDRHQHEITFNHPEDNIPDAWMDDKLLHCILGNLLSNALKYSPEHSQIDLNLQYEGDWAIFQVKDQGIGIPPVEQAQLFESFQRASNVGTIPGTGLGLAIVKKCVDLQGGTISVSSELDVGTLITVKLPFFQKSINKYIY